MEFLRTVWHMTWSHKLVLLNGNHAILDSLSLLINYRSVHYGLLVTVYCDRYWNENRNFEFEKSFYWKLCSNLSYSGHFDPKSFSEWVARWNGSQKLQFMWVVYLCPSYTRWLSKLISVWSFDAIMHEKRNLSCTKKSPSLFKWSNSGSSLSTLQVASWVSSFSSISIHCGRKWSTVWDDPKVLDDSGEVPKTKWSS